MAIWEGGLATHLRQPGAPRPRTDMPGALGGGASAPSPGWYFRAGMASCMATSIALEAALHGIELTRLEVEAHSESDARGMLGSADVPSAPLRFWLKVSVESPHASEAALRALVAAADAHSPMVEAVRRPVAVEIDLQLRAVPGA
ncbi:OsmC family protein [Ramlibacter sp.]|uniref:OsmC family protein n=1 Tax=Ramlibacter sp. TaxID=1917967 RepID=UPI00184D1E94|nr:OsmC family protein [Ramlibacter sp.]MBA2672510.1 OsmC family protein [Ramlibacter sp.]